MLQYGALSFGLGMFPLRAVSSSTSGNAPQSGPTKAEVVKLGDFETDMDDWKTNGGNKLERISQDKYPVGVSSGEYALSVNMKGDLFPVIWRDKGIKNIDFLEYPYIRAHVVTLAENTDSDILAQFRVHHKPTKGKKDSSNGKNGKNTARASENNVTKSDLIEVPQITPEEIQWDMSELSDDIRKSVRRVEMVWYLEDHEPEGGPHGHLKGDFDYQGLILFDDIRLLRSVSNTDQRELRRKKRHLHRAHGMIIDRTFEQRSVGLESGTFVFSDGFSVEYTYETVSDQQFKYSLNGETFKIGGGWQ